jgi:long-chain acyl-CoA synthetase
MKDKPWLKFYEPHVPEHIDYPEIVLPEVLQQTAQKYPSRSAILFKGASINYDRFNRLVDRFGGALQSLGVEKGDRIALDLPNCSQYLIAYYTGLRIGSIVVPCNPVYRAYEMEYQLADSGAEVIVTLSALYSLLKSVRAETQIKHVVVAQIKTYFPPLLRLLFTSLREKKMGHRVDISSDANTHWFTRMVQRGQDSIRPVQVKGEDVAVLMYTGGTTGISKGAMLTHRNLLVNAYQCKVWLNAHEADDIAMVQLPLFHV